MHILSSCPGAPQRCSKRDGTSLTKKRPLYIITCVLGWSSGSKAKKIHFGSSGQKVPFGSGAPRSPRETQGAPGSPREPQEAPGGPREPQGAPGSPREPQEAPGGLREPQGAEQKRLAPILSQDIVKSFNHAKP